MKSPASLGMLVLLGAVGFGAESCGPRMSPLDGGPGGGNGGGTGGAGGGGGSGGGAPVTLSTLCASLASSSCAHTQRCGQLGAAQRADCEAELKARCDARVRQADAGSWRFDAVAAGSCFSDSASVPCYGGPEDLGDCLGAALAPAGRVGAPCEGLECIEGYCPDGPGSTDSCRACTAFTAQGQPCSGPSACNPSVGFCPLVITDGGVPTCEALKGPGSPASPGSSAPPGPSA